MLQNGLKCAPKQNIITLWSFHTNLHPKRITIIHCRDVRHLNPRKLPRLNKFRIRYYHVLAVCWVSWPTLDGFIRELKNTAVIIIKNCGSWILGKRIREKWFITVAFINKASGIFKNINCCTEDIVLFVITYYDFFNIGFVHFLIFPLLFTSQKVLRQKMKRTILFIEFCREMWAFVYKFSKKQHSFSNVN